MSITIEMLKTKKNNGKKLAIHGAGSHGKLFHRILQLLGIVTDCFFDNSYQKNETSVEGIMCLLPENVHNKEEYIVLVCVPNIAFKDVMIGLKSVGFQYVYPPFGIIDYILLHQPNLYRSLFDIEMELPMMDAFYCPNSINQYVDKGVPLSLNNQRIAVYTAVFGGYDEVFLPHIATDNIDYYCISDHLINNDNGFRWVDAKNVIPDNITDPIQKNRYVKMHPHYLFPEYQYSIYIDGNIEILKDMSPLICQSKTGISLFMHPAHDCIFYEALVIVSARRVAMEEAKNQMCRYLQEGMPIHFGMAEMNVIAREHHNPNCIRLMDLWWREFCRYAQRDQFSFSYVLWKNGFSIKDIASLGENVRISNFLKLHKHQKQSLLVANPVEIQTVGDKL